MFLLPFHVVGVSHATTPAELVGRLRLSAERIDMLLASLKARAISAVLLSTCHRTELYWWGEVSLDAWFVQEVSQGMPEVRAAIHVDRADADLAVRHLFSVASGMQSARYGEPEIFGQVRRAWLAARAAGTACGPLDALFRQAIDAARHIRLAMGSEHDPSLGDQVAERIIAHAAEAPEAMQDTALQVLVVGAGDAARGTLDALRRRTVRSSRSMDVAITNRTDTRAKALAEGFGGRSVPWDERDQALFRADVVVFAAHVTTPLMDAAAAAKAPARTRRALWIDLGVPRAVAAELGAPDIEVLPLSSLQQEEAPAYASADDGLSVGVSEGASPGAAVGASLPRTGRAQRASVALQHELERCARVVHRLELGARLGALEERAVAAAMAHGDGSAEGVARRVTRMVLRELTRA